MEVISRHGNYLDDILDWDFNTADKQYYLASSYKLLDKIDVTEVVKMIFVGHDFTRDGIRYRIEDVSFDMIQNRFIASTVHEKDAEKSIPTFFSTARYSARCSTRWPARLADSPLSPKKDRSNASNT